MELSWYYHNAICSLSDGDEKSKFQFICNHVINQVIRQNNTALLLASDVSRDLYVNISGLCFCPASCTDKKEQCQQQQHHCQTSVKCWTSCAIKGGKQETIMSTYGGLKKLKHSIHLNSCRHYIGGPSLSWLKYDWLLTSTAVHCLEASRQILHWYL